MQHHREQCLEVAQLKAAIEEEEKYAQTLNKHIGEFDELISTYQKSKTRLEELARDGYSLAGQAISVQSLTPTHVLETQKVLQKDSLGKDFMQALRKAKQREQQQEPQSQEQTNTNNPNNATTTNVPQSQEQNIPRMATYPVPQPQSSSSDEIWVSGVQDKDAEDWTALHKQCLQILRHDSGVLQAGDLSMPPDMLFMQIRGSYHPRDPKTGFRTDPPPKRKEEFDKIDTTAKLMNVLCTTPGAPLFEFVFCSSLSPDKGEYWQKIRAIEGHARPQGQNTFGCPSLQRVKVTEAHTPFLVFHCSEKEYRAIIHEGHGLRPPIGENSLGRCLMPAFLSATDGLIDAIHYDAKKENCLTPWPHFDDNHNPQPVIAPYKHPESDDTYALYISVKRCSSRGIKFVQSTSLAVTTLHTIPSDDILMARCKNGYMAWCHPRAKDFFAHHCRVRQVSPAILLKWRDELAANHIDVTDAIALPQESSSTGGATPVHHEDRVRASKRHREDNSNEEDILNNQSTEENCPSPMQVDSDMDIVLPISEESSQATAGKQDDPYRWKNKGKKCYRCGGKPRYFRFCTQCEYWQCTGNCMSKNWPRLCVLCERQHFEPFSEIDRCYSNMQQQTCPTCKKQVKMGLALCPHCSHHISGGAIPTEDPELSVIAETDQQDALRDQRRDQINVRLFKHPKCRGPKGLWALQWAWAKMTHKNWCANWEDNGARGDQAFTSITQAWDLSRQFRDGARKKRQFIVTRAVCQEMDELLQARGKEVELTKEHSGKEYPERWGVGKQQERERLWGDRPTAKSDQKSGDNVPLHATTSFQQLTQRSIVSCAINHKTGWKALENIVLQCPCECCGKDLYIADWAKYCKQCNMAHNKNKHRWSDTDKEIYGPHWRCEWCVEK